MIEQCGYPYEKSVRGILFPQMTEDGNRHELLSGSRRVLTYEITPYDIDIKDKEEPSYIMSASIFSKHILTLNIATRHNEMGYHPDMYAAHFIQVALHHLEKKNRINSWEAYWYPDSDNYQMYEEAYARTRDVYASAASTWSARAMARYGFIQIENIKKSCNLYHAIFSRPSVLRNN